MDSPFKFIHVGSPAYLKAYDAFVPASTEPATLIPHLQAIAARQRQIGSAAADWAAGGGRGTQLLLDAGFPTAYAVELVPEACKVLADRVPQAEVVQSSVLDFKPKIPLAVGFMVHLVYPSHVGAANIGYYITHGMEALEIGGTLVVVTMSWNTGTNRALEYFGAPRIDLTAYLLPIMRDYPAYQFTFTTLPAEVSFSDLETTALVARWMLSDQPSQDFDGRLAKEPLTEDSFQRYVTKHFWDGSRGHWHSPPLVVEITRLR